MGLFDTIVNHYKPLGDEFIGVDLQTKSLDCTMSTYWISPAGELFMEDWAYSMEMVDCPNGELGGFRFPFKWAPTGKRKKLTPVYYTGSVIVHPIRMRSAWLQRPWPEATLLFKHGKVIYHETTKRETDETPNQNT